MARLKFTCTTCNAILGLPSTAAPGSRAKCPQCGAIVVLPDPAVPPVHRVAASDSYPVARPVAPPPATPATPSNSEYDNLLVGAWLPSSTTASPVSSTPPAAGLQTHTVFFVAGGVALLLLGLVVGLLVGTPGSAPQKKEPWVARAPNTIPRPVLVEELPRAAPSAPPPPVLVELPPAAPPTAPLPVPRARVEPIPQVTPPPAEPRATVAAPPQARPPAPSKAPQAGSFRWDDPRTWLQDLDQALARARTEQKDVLVLVGFSNSNMQQPYLDAFRGDVFQERHANRYVPVVLGDARQLRTKADVEAIDRIRKKYQLRSIPGVLLLDSKGRHFARIEQTGNRLDAAEVLSRLGQGEQTRNRRDELLAAIDKAPKEKRLTAVRQAGEFLMNQKTVEGYSELFKDWEKLARELDPRNRQGEHEFVFAMAWVTQLNDAIELGADEVVRVAGRLDEWKKTCTFRDANRAAELHLVAGAVLSEVGKGDQSVKYYKAGLACNPTDTKIRNRLLAVAEGYVVRSAGTGFVVTARGYILTNHHVIDGPGRIMVRFANTTEQIPAEVVASDDQRDMALIRLKSPGSPTLKPMRLSGAKPVKRGENVAAFGFPLGSSLGSGHKITQGIISATPEPGTDEMITLDVKVNPGNSGGPLCDTAGNVVGMITAKSRSSRDVESYGLALPATELDAFLRKHLKDYRPGTLPTRTMNWAQIDTQVTPALVTVEKVL